MAFDLMINEKRKKKRKIALGFMRDVSSWVFILAFKGHFHAIPPPTRK